METKDLGYCISKVEKIKKVDCLFMFFLTQIELKNKLDNWKSLPDTDEILIKVKVSGSSNCIRVRELSDGESADCGTIYEDTYMEKRTKDKEYNIMRVTLEAKIEMSEIDEMSMTFKNDVVANTYIPPFYEVEGTISFNSRMTDKTIRNGLFVPKLYLMILF